jgi:tetratricopeptide (TPR) repeat protein
MKLFVAMPYGHRKAPLDSDSPDVTVEIDFDAVWKEILQPAVPEGFETKRADELRRSGLIDRLYIEWLFDADIVLADLTFANPNVYYELGIRQALSRRGTVLVACKGTKLPFDVRNQYVINYDYFAAPALRPFHIQLHEAIENVSGQEMDSPVHVFLPGLSVGRFTEETSPENKTRKLVQRVQELENDLSGRRSEDEEDRLVRKLQEADSASRVFGLYRLAGTHTTCSVDLLERLAIRLRQFGYFDQALEILQQALKLKPQDPELLREMGFVHRKKGPLHYSEAERYMRAALKLNEDDAELHGMLGGLLKRKEDYLQALTHYRRAHELEADNLYPLVNLGGISSALGNTTESVEWYRTLRGHCDRLIGQGKADYWTYLCLGEAAVALGDEDGALAAYRKAMALGPPVEDLRSATEQLEFLKKNDVEAKIAGRVLKSLRKESAAPEIHEGEKQPTPKA